MTLYLLLFVLFATLGAFAGFHQKKDWASLVAVLLSYTACECAFYMWRFY